MPEQTPTLGQILKGNEERDAVHIAIVPVIASELLPPGQHIGLIEDSDDRVGVSRKPIGIVDPFLKRDVKQGQRFYMFLYPGTITSLRHSWTHPAFRNEREQIFQAGNEASNRWLGDYATEVDLTYGELIAAAIGYVKYGNYISDGGKWEGMYVPDEFWDHFENVTGIRNENKGSFFSCSC